VSYGWRLIARLALTLWLASALGLLADQVRERLAPQWPYPEIPSRNPREVEAVIEGCRTLLGQGGTLAIVYPDENWTYVFIAYRLAYLMYPRVLTAEPYSGDPDDDEASAFSRSRQQHASRLLVLGAPDTIAPDLTLVARLGPEARVYRAEPDHP
jgi:hypothetical protein